MILDIYLTKIERKQMHRVLFTNGKILKTVTKCSV